VDDLRTLRLPVDVLTLFPGWRAGSRAGFRPPGLGVKLRPVGAGQPLGALRLQLSPSTATATLTLTLLRDLLRSLDRGVRIVVVVEPEADLQRVVRLARTFGVADNPRVRFVQVRSATLYAQDNARAAVDTHGFPVLLVPRGFRPERGRDESPLDLEEAGRSLGVRAVRSRVYWEGGNVVHDADRCLVGADTIAENVARLGLSGREVLQLLTADFGMKVEVLGDASRARFDAAADEMVTSGQASYHLDLDVSLLGRVGRQRRPVALIAEPAQGLRFLGRVLGHRTTFGRHLIPDGSARELLATEYETAARERQPVLAAYRTMLEKLGYRLIGMPDLRLPAKGGLLGAARLDFSYCNVLPGLHAGRPAVHYLPVGIRPLDLQAEARFRAAGAHPVRVSSNHGIADALMRNSAGLHCVCGPLP
jgi:hypothetical protein